ncbi:rod-binding protein [Parendozoicomonas haliclonae]|uniref:Peptidoglycan hydrolase FlgJ n=1 Tax=Parendozoicomonas haliclonae TaxID=1960125 RepID=A0A1X7ANI4_9GAMM|nr:rod-binding protein [Parendozoicomonas haliclonae]SMA49658.1 Peptidoglycan hydrolase FlgJ [Parendozoicomonas haliclonae]
MDISNNLNASTLAFDPKVMEQHKNSNSPEALRAAAVQFEAMLTEEMLKSMRSATEVMSEDSLFNRDREQFYQGMYDSQLAFEMANRGTFGVAEQLIRQVAEQQAD